MARQLNFSVNPQFLDKHPSSSEYFAKGFESFEGTIEDLAEVVKLGFAFSYLFDGGYRKSSNFLAADFLAVDIDHGKTIQQAISTPIVEKFCSLLYTTPSHSVDRHRFRLVFELPHTLRDVDEVRAASQSLTMRLNGDMSATDGARMFYGSLDCHTQIFGNLISEEFLQELIADGRTVIASEVITNSFPTVSRSHLKLKGDFILRTDRSNQLELKNISQKTRVYCPFHEDENPSAFVAISFKGHTYLHCSTCRLTRWMEDAGKEKEPLDLQRFAQRMVINPPQPQQEELSVLERELGIVIDWDKVRIDFRDEQFLSLDSIEPGLTFIKSPKGSGKTTYLSEALERIIFTSQRATLHAYEEIADEATPFYTDTEVLLIGHRQALIRDLSRRLYLNCYLDEPKTHGDLAYFKKRYGVCLDSIWKVKGKKYDVIVIDEVEQVLSHFLSDTIGGQARALFDIFSNLLAAANKVVLLDADISWTSFNTVITAATQSFTKLRRIRLHFNTHIQQTKDFFLHDSQYGLIEHLKQSLLDGKRIFVTSNSKKKIDHLSTSVDELVTQTGMEIRKLVITSENSRSLDVQEFIGNIAQQILNYQIVLCSPSLGTGVDISFENSRTEIDCVYGLFENRINTHTEIDQQLSRVRQPSEVHVWVSPSRFNFETELGVVEHELLERNFLSEVHDGFRIGRVHGEDRDEYLMMAALIISQQRASKNDLKRNFIAYKEACGWRVVRVSPDNEAKQRGLLFYRQGVETNNQKLVEELCSMPALSQDEFDGIQSKLESNDEEISRIEYLSYRKARIELFYRERITKQLITLDDDWQYQSKVLAYEAVTDQLKMHDLLKTKQEKLAASRPTSKASEKILKNRASGYLLLHALLQVTPFFHEGEIDSDTVYTSQDFDEFIKRAIDLKPFLETHLGISPRSDIQSKPIQFLREILKKIGLEHWRVGVKVVAGKKLYSYRVSPDSLGNMRKYVGRRKRWPSEWDYYDKYLSAVS